MLTLTNIARKLQGAGHVFYGYFLFSKKKEPRDNNVGAVKYYAHNSGELYKLRVMANQIRCARDPNWEVLCHFIRVAFWASWYYTLRRSLNSK